MMPKEKTVLVILAMESEFTALKNKVRAGVNKTIGGISGIEFPIPSGKAFAFQGKIGKVATAFDIGRLASQLDIKAIVNTGVGGALDPTVRPLDVVVANQVAYHDVDLTAFGNPLGQMDGNPLWFKAGESFLKSAEDLEVNAPFRILVGPIISGDKFVTKDNLSPELIQKAFGHPLACDMEGGAVAQVANILHVPFCIIRSISDDTTAEGNKNTYQEFLELAAKHASSVTLWMLNSLE